MIKLYRGDCLDIMPNLPDKSIDMILADLPYNKTQNGWDSEIDLDKLWSEYKRVIKNNGAIVLFGIEPFSSKLRVSNIKMYKYDWIWEKSQSVGHLNSYKRPMLKHELISIFYNRQPNYYPQLSDKPTKDIRPHSKSNSTTNYGKYDSDQSKNRKIPLNKKLPESVIKFNNPQKTTHPTQKPVDLGEFFIKTYTIEGETVLDNTMGSGTFGVSAVNTNRNFIGIEKDCPKDADKHFRTAIKRITEAGGRDIEVIE